MTVVVENEIQVIGLCGRQWLDRATYGSDLAYERRSDKTAFGVGFLSGLQHCPAGLQSFEDKRSCPDFRTGPLMGFAPDDHQEAMLAGALCAGESTLIGQDIEVGLEIVRRRRTSCIVLAGTDAIARQWISAFDTRLQLEPGRITVDECSPSRIGVTVATIEAVCSRLGDDDQGSPPWEVLGCDPGLVIVDGCDLVPVENLRKAVRAFRPRYRCGFVHKHMARTVELMLICHELGPVVYSAAWGRPLHDHPSRFEWRLDSGSRGGL